MVTTGTCGHELLSCDNNGIGWYAKIAGYSHNMMPIVKYSVICTDCFNYYKNNGLLLESADDIKKHKSNCKTFNI